MVRQRTEFEEFLARMDAWQARDKPRVDPDSGFGYEVYDPTGDLGKIAAEIRQRLSEAARRYDEAAPPGTLQVDLNTIVADIHRRHPEFVVVESLVKPGEDTAPYALALTVRPRYRS